MTRAITATELQHFFERFERTAYNYAYRLTRSREDAEDVCQEAKIRALRAVETTKIESNPEAWFLRIIRNCLFDLLRFRRRRVQTVSMETLQSDFPGIDFQDERAQSGFEQVEGQFESVRRALHCLPEDQRALVLASVNGEFSDYASQHPEIPKQRLRTNLSRAHRTIRRILMVDGSFSRATSA